jgi:hypothetical protein
VGMLKPQGMLVLQEFDLSHWSSQSLIYLVP